MSQSTTNISETIGTWEAHMSNYRLPAWEEIPDFGVYMDQVLTLLSTWLDYVPDDLKNDQDTVTQSAINNYVHAHVMPAPVKKKYYREHLAFLVMICLLKKSLSIATIKEILPADADTQETKCLYESFVKRYDLTLHFYIDQLKAVAAPLLGGSGAHEASSIQTQIGCESVDEVIIASALVGGFSTFLAEALIALTATSVPSKH